jgi:hypothetical protein
VPIIESASQPDVAIKTGLSSTEARRRRAESGVAGCMSPVAVRQSAANKRRSSVAVLGHSDGGSAQITDLRGLTVKAEFLKVYSTPARTRRRHPRARGRGQASNKPKRQEAVVSRLSGNGGVNFLMCKRREM